MARRKLRLTAFARFFIVMLFLAPAAYIGASYYNGEDGIENIKKLFGFEQSTSSDSNSQSKNRRSNNSKKTVNYEDLKEENEVLKDSLRSKEQQIYKLKQRIIDLQMNRK